MISLKSMADCKTDVTDVEWQVLQSAIDKANASMAHCDRLLYCEVGVFKGGTFVNALRHIINLDSGKLKRWDCIGIDLFEDFAPAQDNTHISGSVNRGELDAVLSAAGYSGYFLFKGDSESLLKTLIPQQDAKIGGVAFIDGNHTYDGCKRDCMAALDVLTGGGYLVLHNASYRESIDHPRTCGGPYRVAQELVNQGVALPICAKQRMTCLQIE